MKDRKKNRLTILDLFKCELQKKKKKSLLQAGLQLKFKFISIVNQFRNLASCFR